MTRVLKRPMFRIGGSTNEGITSGLGRPGYENGKSVWERTPEELGKVPIGELYEASSQMFQPKSSGDLSRFLIDFGLDIASAEPSGSIFSTAAGAAKEPFARYQKTKAARAESAAESQADLFGQLFKGAIGGDERGFAHRDKAAMVRENMKQQFALQKKLAELNPNDPNREAIENNIRTLKKEIQSPEFAETIKMMFSDERERRELNSLIVEQVRQENPGLDEDSAAFKTKVWQLKKKVFEGLEFGMLPEFNATGGRVGYQAAGSVMGDAIQSTPAMPEELGDISYEELRARLPQEVSDEIVRLLANSAEALEDFATIQTEQDIANFNKKYGVNLVLPAEA